MLPDRTLKLSILTAYSIGLTCFTLSVLGLVDVPFLTIVGLGLLLAPALRFALGQRKVLAESLTLLLVFLPLALVNCLYSARIGYPVGFQDVHSHLSQAGLLLGAN